VTPFYDTEESLQDRLLAALQETPGYAEKKGFFPMELLATLVNEECVAKELKMEFKDFLDNDTIRNYAQNICGIAPALNRERRPAIFKKIFVTLVLSEKTSIIIRFLKEKVTDEDLPLVKISRPGKPRIFDLARRSKSEVALGCFGAWTQCAIRRFEEWQWTTLAPYFARSERKNVKHWILQDQTILPFVSDSRREEDIYDRLEFEGGFSQVFKVDIHPEHHDFYDPHVSAHQSSNFRKNLEDANRNRFVITALLLKVSCHTTRKTSSARWTCSKNSAGIHTPT
jgi:hypothetical protein